MTAKIDNGPAHEARVPERTPESAPQRDGEGTTLEALVNGLSGARIVGRRSIAVHGIAHDSRDVRRGFLFVALRGGSHDGHEYIPSAYAAGACAVVVDRIYAAAHQLAGDTIDPDGDLTAVIVPDTRRALSALAKRFYRAPSQALDVTGVTGTNGKTTVTHLIAAMLTAGGIKCGRIGTLGARLGGAHWALHNTTPLALELQALLAAMRERDAAAVAMEVSSHALELERVADVDFGCGVLTNVTRDHLDFHATFEAYAAAKRKLFALARTAVLNMDDACGRRWAYELALEGRTLTTYGFSGEAEVCASNLELRTDGVGFSCGATRFEMRLPGRFNVSNALAALCVARAHGVPDETSRLALAAFERVPGRMERIADGGIEAIVDYAHTPDALEVVLRAVRESTHGQLCVVFGCGGDRDRGKRPQMGRIASEIADRTIVTSDNPRSEDPRAIVDEVLAGCVTGTVVHAELDRRSAIRAAVANARPGDAIVVAGKGHETYQIVGEHASHFDDRDEVRAALASRRSTASFEPAVRPRSDMAPRTPTR